MKFEKLNENKIRIILTARDLKDKDIDFHDFMSNPIETQDLFLDILEEAKKKVGFNTADYKLKIEALAMLDGDFIVNITRMCDTEKVNSFRSFPKKKFTVRRKASSTPVNQAIYKFDTFDDYCHFIEYLSQNNFANAYLVAKKVVLYIYRDEYYMVFDCFNECYQNILKFYSSITEFATYINNSSLFTSKLYECGKVVIKNNALKTSLKHFEII